MKMHLYRNQLLIISSTSLPDNMTMQISITLKITKYTIQRESMAYEFCLVVELAGIKIQIGFALDTMHIRNIFTYMIMQLGFRETMWPTSRIL